MFWAAHVYAGAVAHLDDEYEGDTPARVRLVGAVRLSIDHSWGLLLAGVIPLLVLTLGVLGVISDRNAIWGTLWMAVAGLGSPRLGKRRVLDKADVAARPRCGEHLAARSGPCPAEGPGEVARSCQGPTADT